MVEKRKIYDSEAEFERDRRKMWGKGYTVIDRRMVPGQRWRWPPTTGDDFFVLVLLWPLWLAGWLLFRKAPEQQMLVTYVRSEEDPG
jgi:hypothetical protein